MADVLIVDDNAPFREMLMAVMGPLASIGMAILADPAGVTMRDQRTRKVHLGDFLFIGNSLQ